MLSILLLCLEEQRAAFPAGAYVLPSSGHPSESNLIALTAACPPWEAARRREVEITVHSEQDATTIIFLSLTLSIFKES